MKLEDYVDLFEDTACKKTYKMVEGVQAVVEAVTKQTAKRCKEITQKRYLSENQAVEIGEKISEEFGV